jgi:hypothetical protein
MSRLTPIGWWRAATPRPGGQGYALARAPAELRMGCRVLRNAGCLPPELEARKEAARLGALVAASSDAGERGRLSRLRADAELRYRLLIERRRR